MKEILFLTNYPSPYRVRFFDELGRHVHLTVLFADRPEEKTHRSADWYVEGRGNFRAVPLTKRVAKFGTNSLCVDVLPWLNRDYDAIVVGGYSNPTVILSMLYLRLRRIPFYMEVDGGLIRQEKKLTYLVKKALVSLPTAWLSTGNTVTDFLVHYGARREKVAIYPFSSISQGELLPEVPSKEEKQALRRELGVKESLVILTIGQFIHRKGFDLLLQAAAKAGTRAGIYIVGGEPTEEYIRMRREFDLPNVHFVGFQKKQTLDSYYRAADLFVLPTREDIWGLVIGEAMANGLPVITTDRCVAGVELVEENVSGHILPAGDVSALAEALSRAEGEDLMAMGRAALEKIRPYTIENMAKVHLDIFDTDIP